MTTTSRTEAEAVQRSVWLPHSLYERVQRIAAIEERKASDVMRRAIRRYVEQQEQ